MNKEQYLEKLREEIETNKKSAIREIEEENAVQATWSLFRLIDLKAQEGVLKREFED